MTLVSAHRCLTSADIEAAIALGADYVEIDVQRTADGALVLHHDPVDVAPPDVLRYADALDLIAGRSRVHLDLKFRGDEVAAVALAVDRLGTDRMLVTTGHDDGVRAVRDWSDAHGHHLMVGLSLGRGVPGFALWQMAKVRASELWPGVRYRHSRANIVVAHHWLARLRVRRFARRHGLPLLVWTVDTPRSLAYWMRPGRAWLVTSNEPAVALRLRADRISP
ncbi:MULTISPECIES: glycerophosphodiester phosphodiesterase [unclassified Nocardioides]|uniref:glycerophosphodiester phosphodiesterase n=1 Tax=Nocardioides sp. URHA0032 TaxID=1380388 RepID=UPI00068650BB|nr:glycerophosphodiester phosphodiesterase [Nocardioides sp. URHA0032]